MKEGKQKVGGHGLGLGRALQSISAHTQLRARAPGMKREKGGRSQGN